MNSRSKLWQKLSDFAFLSQRDEKFVWFEPLVFAFEQSKQEVECKLKQVGYHPIWTNCCEDTTSILKENEDRFYHFNQNGDDQLHIHSLHFKEELARHEVLFLMDIFQNLFKGLFAIAAFNGQSEHNKNHYILASVTFDQEPIELLRFQIKEIAYKEKIAYEIFGVFTWESFFMLLLMHSVSKARLTSSMAFVQAVYMALKSHQGSDQPVRKMLITNQRYRIKIAENHEWLKDNYPLCLKTTSGSLKIDELRMKTNLDEKYYSVKSSFLETEIETALSMYDHELYRKHLKLLLNHLASCASIKDIKEKVTANFAYLKIMWCGKMDCLVNQKELYGYVPYVIPFHQEWFAEVCPICQNKAHHTIYLRKTHNL